MGKRWRARQSDPASAGRGGSRAVTGVGAASATRLPGGLPDGDRFLAQLARILHEAGAPAHRLELLVEACAAKLGVRVSVFSLPTWISISVDEEDSQRTVNFRVEPGFPRIALLEDVYRIADRVVSGELDAAGGLSALRHARARQPRRGVVVGIVGYGLFSAGAASFLGGGAPEMVASFPVGLSVGILLHLAAGRRERELLADFAAAALATVMTAVVAYFAASAGASFSGAVVSLAGLVTLLPGLALATAMSELATRNLSSGTARLVGALGTLVVIGMGATLGDRIVASIGALSVPLAAPAAARAPLTEMLELAVALGLTAVGLGIAFGVRLRRYPLVLVACIVGLSATLVARRVVDGELAPVVAAALVGIAGNLYARFLRKPSVSIVLPGIALLLPGSIGYRGVRGIIGSDTLGGLETGLDALVAAAAIAAGLLVANALVRSPRQL
ncbi:MAG: hypothetical protein RI967_2515 [Planctomycetota bacterium]|jgi:uncharacterized membrane protein YjjP (DUF1212 family)